MNKIVLLILLLAGCATSSKPSDVTADPTLKCLTFQIKVCEKFGLRVFNCGCMSKEKARRQRRAMSANRAPTQEEKEWH